MLEKFSDRNDKIVKGVKRFFRRFVIWIKNNKKMAGVLGTIVVLTFIAIVIILAFRQKEAKANEALELSAAAVLEGNDICVNEVVEVPLEENAYTDLNLFVADYYNALANGDEAKILTLRAVTDDTERIKLVTKSKYIENYQNIICYTKPGPIDNSYVCYVYYEVKFNDLETLVPGLSLLYITKDENDQFMIHFEDQDDAIFEYLMQVSAQDDVVDLFNRVDASYNDIVATNEDVAKFLTDFPEKLKTEVAEELAILETQKVQAQAATEGAGVEEVAVPEEPTEEVVTIETVKANTTVNVRNSDSESATKLGKVSEGTTLTRLEALNNGWSKITYEDGEAYIKSEYLTVVETNTTTASGLEKTGTMVTVKDGVNIRKEASINSEKVGTALAGDKFELVLAQTDGWSKINFNGEFAYIKTEFLE